MDAPVTGPICATAAVAARRPPCGMKIAGYFRPASMECHEGGRAEGGPPRRLGGARLVCQRGSRGVPVAPLGHAPECPPWRRFASRRRPVTAALTEAVGQTDGGVEIANGNHEPARATPLRGRADGNDATDIGDSYGCERPRRLYPTAAVAAGRHR